MSRYRDLFSADMARYGGKPVPVYMRIFLFLYRKATTTRFVPLRWLYKFLFRVHADRRGLEIGSIEQQIGGAFI